MPAEPRSTRALPRLRVVTAVLLIALGAGASALSIKPTSLAIASHCTSQDKLHRIFKREDGFWNYDFADRTIHRCNVSWPINLLFYNNAEINKVKNRMANQGYRCRVSAVDICSNDALRLNDGVDFSWDTDGGGKKPTECYNTTVAHFRIYAAGEGSDRDRMYNATWGFYVLGSSHIDNNECGGSVGSTWYGWSELAEEVIRNDARQEWGANAANETTARWDNGHVERWAGSHLLKNDPRPTRINVR